MKIKDIAERVVTGKTPSTKIKKNYGLDIPFITIPDMHGSIFIAKTERMLSSSGAASQENKFIPRNSIIVSCIGTVGLVSITTTNSQTNQQINSIILPKEYLLYSYLELTTLKGQIEMLGSGGTTIKNLNKSSFENIKINMLNKCNLVKFYKETQPFLDKISLNTNENIILTKGKKVLINELLSN